MTPTEFYWPSFLFLPYDHTNWETSAFSKKQSLVYLSFNLCPLGDTFWRICSRRLVKTLWQKEKLLQWAILPFATMFWLFYNNNSFIYKDFPSICMIVFKVVCCRYVVCSVTFITILSLNNCSYHFQLDSIIIVYFCFLRFAKLLVTCSAADVLYEGKGGLNFHFMDD